MSQNDAHHHQLLDTGDQALLMERIAAANAAGFEGIGLRAETYVDALNEGAL